MSTKPFPAPGQAWTFAGSGFAPSSGPHTVKTLRWFHGTAEAVFDDDSTASIGWMMELDAWQLVDALHVCADATASCETNGLSRMPCFACAVPGPGGSRCWLPRGHADKLHKSLAAHGDDADIVEWA